MDAGSRMTFTLLSDLSGTDVCFLLLPFSCPFCWLAWGYGYRLVCLILCCLQMTSFLLVFCSLLSSPLELLSFLIIHKSRTELFGINCIWWYLAGMKGVLLSSKYISWCFQVCTQVRTHANTWTWCFPGNRRSPGSLCHLTLLLGVYFFMGAAIGRVVKLST